MPVIYECDRCGKRMKEYYMQLDNKIFCEKCRSEYSLLIDKFNKDSHKKWEKVYKDFMYKKKKVINSVEKEE